MDFLTILKYVLAVVETAALLGALVYSARAIHENKNKKYEGKKGAKSKETIEKNVSAFKRNAAICFFAYLILNVFRNYSGVFQ
ncbi:MAG: hypothetical protein IKD27_08935 [Oscillospiraceae bacterium]|nr:hypothetical protein [Oscillospiraceae bacterium]